MERLPYIDEHAMSIGASPERTWAALVAMLRRVFGRGAPLAHVLGCEQASTSPRFDGAVGQTLPGFHVAESAPGRRLVLRGRHRFARYELTFVLEDGELRAQTRAAFPGVRGRVYRMAVIGAGAIVDGRFR